MNRNHQGRNDQNRTNQGRHKIAYSQMGRSYQSPTYQSFSKQFGHRRIKEDDDHQDEWVSHFNQPGNEQTLGHHFNREDHWSEYENDETKSYDYDRFHKGDAPIAIYASEKYRHQEAQNKRSDFHGRDLSYRARMERHPERFVGENDALLEQQFTPQVDYSGLGPKTYNRSDEQLQDEVCNRLAQDRFLDASELLVDVEQGVVKLAGTVKDREKRFTAERIVSSIWGVVDIENDIRVGVLSP